MLTLAQVKTHLKLDAAEGPEDDLLRLYLSTAVATFEHTSKKRFPEPDEPTAPVQVGAATVAAIARPAVLTGREQLLGVQWLLLTLGHWYENRGTVAVGLNVTEVPHTAGMLMNILREPTL
ncbi:MAG: head-tail connector protein [Janthinobacterium lividum]